MARWLPAVLVALPVLVPAALSAVPAGRVTVVVSFAAAAALLDALDRAVEVLESALPHLEAGVGAGEVVLDNLGLTLRDRYVRDRRLGDVTPAGPDRRSAA